MSLAAVGRTFCIYTRLLVLAAAMEFSGWSIEVLTYPGQSLSQATSKTKMRLTSQSYVNHGIDKLFWCVFRRDINVSRHAFVSEENGPVVGHMPGRILL
jgi:hypothetical protein